MVAAFTTPWFSNALGQRLDVRAFVLPAAFAADRIASFTITQVNAGDPAVLAGLTFSSDASSFGVPEPAGVGLLGLGITGLGMANRAGMSRRRR